MSNQPIPRTRRIGEQLRRELAELIRDVLGDPRLALILYDQRRGQPRSCLCADFCDLVGRVERTRRASC